MPSWHHRAKGVLFLTEPSVYNVAEMMGDSLHGSPLVLTELHLSTPVLWTELWSLIGTFWGIHSFLLKKKFKKIVLHWGSYMPLADAWPASWWFCELQRGLHKASGIMLCCVTARLTTNRMHLQLMWSDTVVAPGWVRLCLTTPSSQKSA